MSYLIENSKVITQKDYEENEDKYLLYKKYPLGDYFLLSVKDKPFFSIYDIANYCKKRYKKDKVFLIVHRYFDRVEGTKITEFYLFNTIHIFEKPLTSVFSLKGDEIIHKQNAVIYNVNLAKKLLNEERLHIILGDNIKEHEVVEYLNLENNKCEIEFFDSKEVKEKFKKPKIKYTTPENIRISRISKILKTIRILEPKEKVIRNYIVMILSAFLIFYFSDEYISEEHEVAKKELKREKRNLQNNLRKINKNLQLEKRKYVDQSDVLKLLEQKDIYKPE